MRRTTRWWLEELCGKKVVLSYNTYLCCVMKLVDLEWSEEPWWVLVAGRQIRVFQARVHCRFRLVLYYCRKTIANYNFAPKISIFSPGNSTNIAWHQDSQPQVTLFKRIPLNRPPPVLENEMHHIIRADLLSSKAGLASVPWWVEDHDRLRTFPRFFFDNSHKNGCCFFNTPFWYTIFVSFCKRTFEVLLGNCQISIPQGQYRPATTKTCGKSHVSCDI